MRIAVAAAALLLSLSMIPSPAQAQEQGPDGGRKSEAAATALAVLFPGAGHIYAAEPGRGLLLMGATGLAFMYAFGDAPCKRPFTDVRTCELEDKNDTLVALSLGTTAAIYLFNVWDAHLAARRTNDRRRLSIGPVELLPRLLLRTAEYGGPAVGIGMELARRTSP